MSRIRKMSNHASSQAGATSTSILRNVRWGVGWGLGLATAFSVFVGVMVLLRGSTVYDDLGGVTTFQMAVFYYSAGVTGGTLVGLLRPIQHRYVGRFITAFLTLFLVYGGCSLVFLPALNEESANPVSAKFMLVACALLSLIVAPLYVRIVGSWRSE